VNSIKIALHGKKIAVVAAMIHGILFSLYGNCRDKIRALPCYQLLTSLRQLGEANRLATSCSKKSDIVCT
jgi:hypothetical protein